MSQEIQKCNYCFTYNYGRDGQPSKANVEVWWEALQDVASYAIGGWEIAPSTGQPHLQGYVQLSVKSRITALKKLTCGNTVNWRAACGDEEQNFIYCTKDGNYMEFGEAKEVNPGKREKKRWKEALTLAKAGTYDDIDPQIQVMYMRNLDYIRDKFQPDAEDNQPEIKHIWIWGPTGSGKSRRARQILKERFPTTKFYNKLQNKWWDHYRQGQPALLDDLELEVGKMLVGYLKNWLDMYAYKVEYKGGAKDVRPPLMVITSNYHPWDMFGSNIEGWYAPIMRRLEVQYLGLVPGETPPERGPGHLNLPDPGLPEYAHGASTWGVYGAHAPSNAGTLSAPGAGPATQVLSASPTPTRMIPIPVELKVIRVRDDDDVIDLT